jgi:hypothetical protein
MKPEVLHDPQGGEPNKSKFMGKHIAYAWRREIRP